MRWCVLVVVCLLMFAENGFGQSAGNVDWPRVGNDPGCMRYSELKQIDRDNVARFKPAWTYHTGEFKGRAGKTIECTPIVIDGVMYVTTGYLRVVALDAATGTEFWQFRSAEGPSLPARTDLRRRQPRLCVLVRWPDARRATDRARHGGWPAVLAGCENRPARPEVWRCRAFSICAWGSPRTWLRSAMGRPPPRRSGRTRSSSASPAVKVRNSPHPATSAPSMSAPAGKSGVFAPCPVPAKSVTRPGKATPGKTAAASMPGAASASTWSGAWSSPVWDRQPSISMAAIGGAQTCSPTARSLSNAKTGDRVWHFQTLHHDLWDHDLPVYPNLVTVTHDGKRIDAVAQVTKTGYVFLFDRETGKPLFAVEEKARARLGRARRGGLADAAGPREAAALRRAVLQRDKCHEHRQSEPGVGAGPTANHSQWRSVSTAELPGNRSPFPDSWGERTGPGPRSIRHAVCSSSTRTTADHHHAREAKPGKQPRYGPYAFRLYRSSAITKAIPASSLPGAC